MTSECFPLCMSLWYQLCLYDHTTNMPATTLQTSPKHVTTVQLADSHVVMLCWFCCKCYSSNRQILCFLTCSSLFKVKVKRNPHHKRGDLVKVKQNNGLGPWVASSWCLCLLKVFFPLVLANHCVFGFGFYSCLVCLFPFVITCVIFKKNKAAVCRQTENNNVFTATIKVHL